MNKFEIKALLLIGVSTFSMQSMNAAPVSFQQAVADYTAGKYGQANAELESYKQAYPTNAMVHYYSALCKQALGQLEGAKTEFQWVAQSGDPRLKALGQTGFDQLSKAKTSISSNAVAVAPPSGTASPAAAPKQLVASSNARVKTIIEFWAEWCGPCKEFAPTFEAVTSKFRDITIQKVNLDENKELASKYSVVSIPRMIMLDASGNAFYNDSPPRDAEELTQLIQSHR